MLPCARSRSYTTSPAARDVASEWIAATAGKRSLPERTDVLSRRQVDRLASVLGVRRVDGDDKASHVLGTQWMLFDAFSYGELAPDGFVIANAPPAPFTQRMWAGGCLTFHSPIPYDTPLKLESTMREPVLKSGKSGDLIFVTVVDEISTQSGDKLMTDEMQMVYRTAPLDFSGRSGDGGSGESALPEHEWRTTFAATPLALFQYSALTYNSHLIHYDPDYARKVEGYPEILMHGPLTATLLANLSNENAAKDGQRVERFAYKAVAPVFCHQNVTLGGSKEQSAATAQAFSEKGQLCMTADITLCDQA